MNCKSFKYADGRIFTRANSECWQVAIPLISGKGKKTLRLSSGIRIADDPNHEQARNFLSNIRYTDRQMASPTKKEQAYRQALKMIADECGYTHTRLKIKDAISNYLGTVTAQQATKLNYIAALSKFQKHFGGETFIDTVTPKQLEEFQKKQLKLYNFFTVKTTMNTIKFFWNYLKKFENVDTDPCKQISVMKHEKAQTEKEAFTEDQIHLLLNETKGTYWETAIYLGYYTGQRLMDIFNLTWDQVDLINDKINFHIRKTKKELVSTIHPSLKKYLLSIPNKVGKLCNVAKSQESLSIEFHKLLLKLHIIEPSPKGEGKRKNRSALTFHSLRRTLNSIMASKHIPVEIRCKIIGNSPQINQRHYTNIRDEAVKEAFLSLNI